jgi:hypothetical protein
MKFNRIKSILVALFVTIVFIGCQATTSENASSVGNTANTANNENTGNTGNNENTGNTRNTEKIGVFIDAKVQGLKYKTATLTSYTNYRGEFRYKDGEDVEFFIGNISLGSVKAKSIITPCTLAGDKDCKGTISKKALNIAMLLQNLDSDRADKNVLNLSRLKYINLGDINLGQTTSEMESDITDILATASLQNKFDSNRTLIDTQHAKEHMLKNVNGTAGNDSDDSTDSGDDSTDTTSHNKCNLKKIDDDSGYVDIFPPDIPWEGPSDTVEDIERVFNKARALDPTITQKLILPSQAVWDKMSVEERGLYITNNERYYRGLKPFEGISHAVSAVSKKYAQTMYDKGEFGHHLDGSPWDRMFRNQDINDNHDYFKYGENIYTYGSSAQYVKNPVARAMYGFIYDDNASTDGSYGHRKFTLAVGLNDNSGEDGVEGLVGFAIKKGREYHLKGFGDGWYSTIVVMNAFDPSVNWDHSTTLKVPFCTKATQNANSNSDDSSDSSSDPDDSNTNDNSKRFTLNATKGTVVDSETSLMWQNTRIGHGERDKAIDRCKNLDFAGFSDWRLPKMSESKVFHYEMNKSGNTPKQAFAHCTAEVVTDGYVRTKKGSERYGKNPGDPIGFTGGANIRCVRAN